MPPKSPRQQAKESQLIAWYKWEFLRRNSEYRKDYEAFIDEFGGWFEKHGYWYDQTVQPWGRRNLRFFATRIAPKAKTICERWQIRDPFSPDWKFTPSSGFYHYKPGYEVLLPTDWPKELAGEEWDLSDFLMFNETEFRKSLPVPRWPRAKHLAVLAFDLRRSLPFLLSEAEDRIRTRKRNYDRRHPQPSKIASPFRRRLDRYDDYLKVWDLRTHHREKYLYIGTVVFGSASRVEQRAIDSFNQAQALISGGYKELK